MFDATADYNILYGSFNKLLFKFQTKQNKALLTIML